MWARACVRARKGEEEETEEMFEEVEFFEEIRYMFMFFRCKLVQFVYYSYYYFTSSKALMCSAISLSQHSNK